MQRHHPEKLNLARPMNKFMKAEGDCLIFDRYLNKGNAQGYWRMKLW